MEINGLSNASYVSNLPKYKELYDASKNMIDELQKFAISDLSEELSSIDLSRELNPRQVACLEHIFLHLKTLKTLLLELEKEHKMLLAVLSALLAIISMTLIKKPINPDKYINQDTNTLPETLRTEEIDYQEDELHEFLLLLRKKEFIQYERNENDIKDSTIIFDTKTIYKFINKFLRDK